MWALMKVFPWSSIENDDGVPLKAPEKGTGQPRGFIPVFDDLADAEAFANDDEKHLITELFEY